MSNIKSQRAALNKQLNFIQKQIADLDDVESGDKPSPKIARLIKHQSFSYRVSFERRKALRRVRSPGSVCVSQRRFSSTKEANQHGKRFAKKHRHAAFWVERISRKANAWINWTTGKTNPVP